MTGNNDIGFLFDLDGVLIDSEREYTRIWHEINLRYPTGVENFERVIKGTTLTDILDRYFSGQEVRDDVVRILYERESQTVYTPCEGAMELLTGLRSRGIPAAIVTSSDKAKMAKLNRQLPNLPELVDAIIDGSSVSRSKPDPEGYLLGARAIGRDPRRCAVFEDSLQGLRAGRAAGALVVGMSDTLGHDIIAPEADITLGSLTDLDLDTLVKTLHDR